MEGKKASCMLQFKGEAKLTSKEFVKVFKEFDKDGNGFIEADELTDFLVALLRETGNENPNEVELIEFKQFILDKFDDNFDGKISMPELKNILPTEENYLAQFQDEFQANKMDSVQFIKIWNHYDSDMSGYLEGTNLIKDFKQFIVRLLLNCMAQTNRNNFRVEIAEGVAKQISYGIRFLQESMARSDQAT
ncbi:calbindin-32-like [Montipora capricornis]|uniref:calbindin-32-like n=1 Tax=Montipora foliosa TaxID=591990 RepID=UPI0035F1B191